jgi:hypothetical protein
MQSSLHLLERIFKFMACRISQKNKASQRVTEKAEFNSVLKMAYLTGGQNL